MKARGGLPWKAVAARMADCELSDTCLFFNDQMADMPSMSSIIKDRYCKGSNTLCARHMVFRVQGREAVPKDLYPSQIERADEILGNR
jgi:hypothetical protein